MKGAVTSTAESIGMRANGVGVHTLAVNVDQQVGRGWAPFVTSNLGVEGLPLHIRRLFRNRAGCKAPEWTSRDLNRCMYVCVYMVMQSYLMINCKCFFYIIIRLRIVGR